MWDSCWRCFGICPPTGACSAVVNPCIRASFCYMHVPCCSIHVPLYTCALLFHTCALLFHTSALLLHTCALLFYACALLFHTCALLLAAQCCRPADAYLPSVHTRINVPRASFFEKNPFGQAPRPTGACSLLYTCINIAHSFLEGEVQSTHFQVAFLLCTCLLLEMMFTFTDATITNTSTITTGFSVIMACRQSWKLLAAGKAPPDPKGAADGQHVHLQFCNMIINDSTYLLGEALEKLPQVSTTCRLSLNLCKFCPRNA